ncbi:Crp/Fnr family transcriptional regulator [Aliarcobacter butzleri]|uniref:Crp/Fnr family transcriptional regulator n=1 Tax=Aliarcobacter butzleri TaxID=28197 RepID=UPI0021B3FF3C|nr:hypothetical protein [Aliarcobacter butzleri]MCT7646322.1 hypothetical protein [Aliarcobacter butzleri]
MKNIQKTSFGNKILWSNGCFTYKYTNNLYCSSFRRFNCVDIQYDKYREILAKYDDLKMYHILYLEKHWIMQKDDNGYSLVLEDAKQRYERFKKEFGHIISRLSQYQIASYLGISPTHLSRIKKES